MLVVPVVFVVVRVVLAWHVDLVASLPVVLEVLARVQGTDGLLCGVVLLCNIIARLFLLDGVLAGVCSSKTSCMRNHTALLGHHAQMIEK